MSNQANNLPGNPQEQALSASTTQAVKSKKRKNRFGKYLLRHKMVFSLLFALIAVFVWAQLTIRKQRKEKEALIASMAITFDSLNVENHKTLATIFTWTIRNDLMRKNIEQLDKYLINVVQLPYIKKAYIIDPESKTILLSTDSSENGLPVSDITLLHPKTSAIQMNDSTFRLIAPVTGLSGFIGISVLEADFRK